MHVSPDVLEAWTEGHGIERSRHRVACGRARARIDARWLVALVALRERAASRCRTRADDDLPGRVGRVANRAGHALPRARRERRRLGGNRPQLSDRAGRQPVGRARRPRRDRLRRRPVPARRRHEPARVAPRRSAARAVRRGGPRHRPRARARSRRLGARSTRRPRRSRWCGRGFTGSTLLRRVR